MLDKIYHMMSCSISIKMVTLINICLIVILRLIKAEQNLQCGDWDAFKDEKCFKVYDNTDLQSYDNAKNRCYQNEVSSLVSIQSQEEQEFLVSLLLVKQNIVNDVWIGGQYVQNHLKWTDNSIVDFTNWANGYPQSDSEYECVKMAIVEPYHGKWLNSPCNQSNVIVCQKPQNWLVSYLQKTVMELRATVDKVSKQLEITNKNLNETIKSNDNLQEEIKKSTPPGTIAYFSNTSAPNGWLKANGQTVSRTEFSNLFASIGTTFGSGDGSTTFTLPDLRGEFIRGWSDGRDVDKERTFASFQWGSSIPYVSYIDNNSHVSSSTGFFQHRAFAGKTFDGGYQTGITPNQIRNGMTFDGWHNQYFSSFTDANMSGSITSWSVLQGTRPRNIALLACIKY